MTGDGASDKERRGALALSYLAFREKNGIGPATVARLIREFGGTAAVLERPASDLREAGIAEDAAKAVAGFQAWDEVDKAENALRLCGARVVVIGDDEYPVPLAAIDPPPPILYIQGSWTAADALSVSVVGSRKPTEYGTRIGRVLSRQIAECGVTIVSGLAYGIDAAAHAGALEAAGGRTIAVLGSGIDRPYPAENASLSRKIASQGAVISEFFPGTAPVPANFPIRNRIIAGLSMGVLVVEAGDKSGTMITVRYGAEQGKPIFGVPGPIDAPMSAGPHRLIRDGATPVFEALDVVGAIVPEFARRESLALPSPPSPGEVIRRLGLTGDAALVVEALTREPRHVDEIAAATGLAAAALSALLLDLEIRGAAAAHPGKRYTLNPESR
ncbi:DNA-processing protein DprA [bacterium]|nr:DNA-processing protein DprA [bacterium]